jgi:hypothetical protein
VARLVAESFGLLETRLPTIHERLKGLLRDEWVELRVDGETLVIDSRDGLRVATAGAIPTVAIQASKDAILDLSDGVRTLNEALLGGTVSATGTLAHVAVVHEALRVYLHGLVRSVEAATLLTRLRHMARGERS